MTGNLYDVKWTHSLESATSKLTKYNHKSHLYGLDFCFRNETSRAGSSAVLALQSNLPPSGLCEGD